MVLPQETSSSFPAFGSKEIFKDTMNTFSTTTQEQPEGIKPTTITTNTLAPLPSPSSPLLSPATSSADNSSISPPLVHTEKFSFDTLNIPKHNSTQMSSNHNQGADIRVSIDSNSNEPNDDALDQQDPGESSASAPHVFNVSPVSKTPPARKSNISPGSKALGFLGSLSPKGSKNKMSRQITKPPRPASPPLDFQTLPGPPFSKPSAFPPLPATSSQANIQSRTQGSININSLDSQTPSATQDHNDLYDPRPGGKSRDYSKEKKESKRSKEKDSHHPHLGQRLYMAMGLSSSSSSKAQQRGGQESVDSLSASENLGHHQSTSDESQKQHSTSSPDRERKGGLMSHFLRPRLTSASEDHVPNNYSSASAPKGDRGTRSHGRAAGSAILLLKNADQHDQLTSVSATSTSAVLSGSNSDASFQSGHGTDNEDDKGDVDERQSSMVRGLRGFGHSRGGSSSNGKSMVNSSLFQHRRGSLQIPIPGMFSQSIANVIGSSTEVHSQHARNDRVEPGHNVRLDKKGTSQTGMGTENHDDHRDQQLRGIHSMNDGSPLSPSCGNCDQDISQKNNSPASGDGMLGASMPSSVTDSKSSSKLGRLGRFKFPSLSMGNLHRNKSSAGAGPANTFKEPVPNNIRRGSLPAFSIAPSVGYSFRNASAIHGSGSASTFASINTTAMTALGETTPGSSNHSSISSSFHGLDVGGTAGIKKSWQSLTGFMEEHSHHPHHSSTAITIQNGQMSHRPVLESQDLKHHNTPPQHHRSGTRNIFGSERFTSSTSGSSELFPAHSVQAKENGFTGAVSGKCTSRRTVSVGHISSGSIFGADESGSSDGPNLAFQQHSTSPMRHFRSERNMQSAVQAPFTYRMNAESGERVLKPSTTSDGSVGRYLFGNELSTMDFGEAKTRAKGINTESYTVENTTAGVWTSSASATSLAAITGISSTPSPVVQIATPGPFQLRAKKKSNPSFFSAVKKGHAPAISAPPAQPTASKLSGGALYPDSAIALASLSTIRDSTMAANPSPALYSELSASPVSTTPLSPAALASAKCDRYYPPTPSESHSPASSFVASMAPSNHPAKAKFSIMGSSNNHSSFGSYSPTRPTFSHSHSSGTGTTTSALNLATTVSSQTASTSTTLAGSGPSSTFTRNPNIPHLVPRSAIADYTPIIYYKRQRSMSLQDADLLTADQFIALLPDDLPPKRRFSSEEVPPENPWYTRSKIKNVPLPDPPTTLRALLSKLKTKCGLVIEHLDAVSASVPDSSATVPAIVSEAQHSISIAAAVTMDSDVKESSRPSVSAASGSPSVPSSDQSNCMPGPPSPLMKVQTEDQTREDSRATVPGRGTEPEAQCSKQERATSDGIYEQNRDANAIDADEEPVLLRKDVVETVTALFEEMDHTMTQMAEMLSKYISTEQFSKLTKELDEMCFLAQEVLRAEVNGCQQPHSIEIPKSANEGDRSHDVQQKAYDGERDQSFVPKIQDRDLANAPAEPEAMQAPRKSREEDGMHTEEPKKKRSQDMADNRRDQNLHKHQYRYQPPGPRRKSEDTGTQAGRTVDEQRETVKDYIQTISSMAEICVAEFIRVYNRMLVVPTTGYRIEGCNDLKKIERALRPDPPRANSLPLGMAVKVSSQPSLLSRASAVQKPITHNFRPTSESGSFATEKIGDKGSFTALGTASSVRPLNGNNIRGHAMTRVKSLPESKDERAVFQRHKEMGGSPGVTGAISMGGPVTAWNGSGAGDIGSTTLGTGAITAPGMTMLGEYSKEHMGHEAYYYRNWFLGKEHRTFVGQVEGLGTVIISIIKDMVIPADSRPAFSGRSSTAPAPLALPVSISSTSSTSSLPIGGSATPSARPELVHHSSYSYFPSRGAGLHLGGGAGSSSLVASPRSSSEAMRIILSASTAVVTGSGSASDGKSSSSGGKSVQIGSSTATGVTHSSSTSVSQASNNNPNGNGAGMSSSSHISHSSSPPRWQYRCILRQKDVDSLRITLPEPEAGPLNNLARRAGKPQWKTILQSIHPAITQQVASKLKKVETNPQFEKDLARFDETMLRFNYKFGVLLVQPGQTKEEDWFSNQKGSSERFQEFLDSGALGEKVALKGFERFSAGLDTRSDAAEHSYFDTWGEGFEIMYHVSTLLPFNTGDRQQIQRKRHIGNDIVCIVFVDGEQPFVPNAIKSQFLHIFVVIHPVSLPDGTRGYSAAIASDEQVPEFGPPLPDPPIFKTSQELRSFLLCKMINGENAAYKAPRLIKPHQRARSGMLENLVAKANCLTKDKDTDKKVAKHQKAANVPTADLMHPTPANSPLSAPTSLQLSVSSAAQPYVRLPPASASNQDYTHPHGTQYHHPNCSKQLQHGSYDKGGHFCHCMIPPASPSKLMNDDDQHHPHAISNQRVGFGLGPRAPRSSLTSETASSIFRPKRRNSNTEVSTHGGVGFVTEREPQVHSGAPRPHLPRQEYSFNGSIHMENLISPVSSSLPSTPLIPRPASASGGDKQRYKLGTYARHDQFPDQVCPGYNGHHPCCGCGHGGAVA